MNSLTLEVPVPARTEGTRRAPFPQSRAAARGLCRTCSREPDCTYPRASERAVTACDEFDALRLAWIRTTGLSVAAPARPGVAAAPSPRGLCGNCERRFDCTFPRGEAGVWHCEEYV